MVLFYGKIAVRKMLVNLTIAGTKGWVKKFEITKHEFGWKEQ